MPAGRPTRYTKKLAAEICAMIALGESVASIVRKDSMPSMSTIYKWLSEKKEFSELYARAREDQVETLVDEMLDIVDNQASEPLVLNGEIQKIDGKEVQVVSKESIAHAKLRLDARKWLAVKLKPRKYGTKQEITIKDKPVSEMSEEELDAIIAEG